MSFVQSVAPDITEAIPSTISARVGSPIYVARGVAADVSIGDLPFRFALDDQHPYQRQTADFRRQQIDTSKEPGEQSLAQWWVRTLDSWHRGAGIRWYEPGSDELTTDRYESSVGLDVWTKGEVSLLKALNRTVTATTGQLCVASSGRVGSADVIFGVVAGTMFRHDGTTRTNYTGSSSVSCEPVVAGQKVLAGSTAGILSGDASGTSLSALWTSSSGAAVRPWWVKSRIVAARGADLYDLTMAGGSIDSSTPLYTHPSSTWTWSAVAEAPGAILAAGYDNGFGYVYAFTLESAGSGLSPTLGSPIQIADFPPGEEVYSIKSYLSSYLAIGTTRGVRVALMQSNSSGGVDLQYGPLVIETTKPVRALGARDSFIFAGIEADIAGNSGAARIDLSEAISDLRFAWAYDGQAHATGTVQSICFLGTTSRLVIGLQGQGVYIQSPTNYEASGYFVTGRIRYATSEPKSFDLAKIRADLPSGTSAALTTLSETGNEEFILSFGESWNTGEDITLRSIADTAQSHAQLKISFSSSEDRLSTPTVQSVQLKATPLPRLQRLISYPLRIEDVEQDRNGQKTGKRGDAMFRLLKLEELQEKHSVVLVHDYTSGEAFSGQIRDVQFTRNTPSSRNRGNFGGTAQVVVLKT